MIKFEHDSGDLKCAIFGGSISDLSADLCLEMSLIYGAIRKQSKGAAEEFRKNMLIAMADHEIADKIFSTELYDDITKSDSHLVGNVAISDKEEFARQLKELLDESE